MMMMKRNILFALSVLLLSAAPLPANSAEEGSLDSMWVEQGDKDTAKPADAAVPAEEKPKATSAEEKPKATADEDTAAPMCTLDNFKSSAIVSKGGWPGVGPFNPDTNNDYFDEHHNKLHVDLNGQQITHAQLDLTNRELSGNPDKDLLDMQMHIDFFLEAVGIKPVKIQDLNSDLAKNKNALLKNDDQPLSLTAGRCAVTIEKKKAVDGSKVDYSIAVSSLDANQTVLKQHSVSETARATTPPPKQPDITAAQPSMVVVAPPAQKPEVKPVATAPQQPAPSDAVLKEQFTTLISNWQKVKKNAVRNKQTEELSSVLAGKALIRQTDAVKWLNTNKKYYDMNPKGVTVDQLAALAPAKKYMVAAQVHEAYKFIDEPTGKVLKEVDDINKVNYTIEKIAGRWVITDSALLSAPAQVSTNKTKTPR